jgi:hypothetical protein
MKNSEEQKLEDGQDVNDVTFEDAFEQTGKVSVALLHHSTYLLTVVN